MYEVNQEVYYRAYATVYLHYMTFNDDGDVVDFGSRKVPEVKIRYDEFPVLRHTPCGVWLGMEDGTEKWVGKKSRSSYAKPTKEEALISLQIRNRHRIRHLKEALAKAEAIRKYMESEKFLEEKNDAM